MPNNNSIQHENYLYKKLTFMEQSLKAEFPVSHYDIINQGITLRYTCDDSAALPLSLAMISLLQRV